MKRRRKAKNCNLNDFSSNEKNLTFLSLKIQILPSISDGEGRKIYEIKVKVQAKDFSATNKICFRPFLYFSLP